MRILAVTPWVPGPERPRSLELLRELSQDHEIVLVAATWNAKDDADLAHVPVSRVVGVRLGRWSGAARSLAAVVTGGSLQQAFLDSPRMRRAIAREVRDVRPEILYANVIRSAHLLADIALPATRVVDLDEFRSRFYRQMAVESRSPIWRGIARMEASRMSRAERTVLEAFDGVLVSSPLDLQPGLPKVHLVRSAHAMGDLGARSGPGVPGRIVFVGRQSYRANREAVQWFASRVLPSVVRAVPEAHLQIVGASPPRAVRNLASERVEVTGAVPEVAPYYTGATVAVVPVMMATGVQMKLIEAMALGVPVVASPAVAATAGVQGGRHLLVAETPAEWSRAVARLLEDKAEATRLAYAAREWYEAHHSKEAVTAALRQAVRAATSRRGLA